MFNIKSIMVLMLVPVIVLSGMIIWKAKEKQDYADKVILAKESRKVMDVLMFDLRGARQGSVLDVPVDGKWHDRIAFEGLKGPVEYFLKEGRLDRLSENRMVVVAQHIASLKMRRQSKEATVVEVQINAHNKTHLGSNFKIRMQE